MKIFTYFILGIMIFSGFTGCGNSKKITEQAPWHVQESYYQDVVLDGETGKKLFLTLEPGKETGIKPEHVFFQNKMATLALDPDMPDHYTAFFPDKAKKDSDYIMSSDPKKEYGNKAPVIEEIPFDLELNQAVVAFGKNNKIQYFKVEGIEKRGTSGEPIKKPENIRH